MFACDCRLLSIYCGFVIRIVRRRKQTRAYLTRPPRPFPLSLRPPSPLTSLRPKAINNHRHDCRCRCSTLHTVCHLVRAFYFTDTLPGFAQKRYSRPAGSSTRHAVWSIGSMLPCRLNRSWSAQWRGNGQPPGFLLHRLRFLPANLTIRYSSTRDQMISSSSTSRLAQYMVAVSLYFFLLRH